MATVATTLAALAVAVAVLVSLRRADDTGQRVGTTTPTAATPATASPATTVPRATPATTGPPPTPPTTVLSGPVGGAVPAGFRPVSVTWISLRQGWALGTAPCATPPCTSLVRTLDAGATWQGVPAPRAELTTARLVRFADETNGWIFGPDLWATHDGGATWRRVDSVGGPVTSLEAGAGTAYALVGTAPAHVSAATVGSDAWRPLGPDDIASGSTLALHGPTGYAQGADGAVRAVTPTTLDRRGSPCGSNPASGLAATGTGTDVLAVCVSDAGAGSSTKAVVVSHDGARTWTAAAAGPPRGGQPSGLAAASPSTWVVAANSGASYLYRSEDGGATWATVFTDTASGGAGFVDLGFTDASRGLVVEGASTGSSRLLVTSDGGRTWSPVTFGP
jgi:photosystem II stability/assembly factor-like uncharacterized protein